MRGKLNWSQGGLAKASGLTQGVISRAENPNYGNLTFNTALRIAAGFDVAFVGWFVPFSKLTEWFENMSEESMQIASFKEEDSIEQEQKLPAIAREATAGVITNLARIEKVKKEIPSATDLASDGRNYGKEKLGLAQTQL